MPHVVLPELGDGIEKAVIACWHYKVGEAVNPDDDIVELVTDKASFNVSAGEKGILQKILVAEGAEAKIGEVLAVIEPKI